MSVKGAVKNDSEVSYQKWVGVENFSVIAFNPDKSELEAILDTEIENEPVYTKEDKDGNPMSNISVWLKGEESGQKFNMRINLIDKDRISQSGKTQYINSVGITSYSDDKANLPEWFTHFTDREKNIIGDKSVRVAKVGEEELYSFLRAWLYLDYFKPETELVLNFKKLIIGDVRELNELIKSEFARTFVGVAMVRSVEKDGDIKQYQGVSTKAFLSGELFKFVKLGNWDKYNKKKWEKFKEAFEGEYGEKAFYSIELIHHYDENEDFTASNSTKKEINEEDSTY